MSFKMKKMEVDLFFKKREELLKKWRFDENLILSSSIKFHNYLPSSKNFSQKLKKNNITKNKGLQVGVGVNLLEEQLNILSSLSKEKEIEFISIILDSFSRENKFENAQKAIEESKKIDRSILNGFPIVNYGIELSRRMINEVKVPLQLKHGSTNSKLISEISIAAGITSIEGGGISYNIPYSKSVSIDESIENWKYVDRLIGYYEENGVSIHRESFSTLTATLVPPAISNVIQILECLLAAEQGVKNISLGCSQYGNLIQDIAAIEALKEDAKKYCEFFEFKDVTITTVFHQWIGGFPNESMKSYGLISYSALTGFLSDTDRIYIRNPEENGSKYLNISLNNALELTKSLTKLISFQKITDYLNIDFEKKLIKKEVEQIMNRILEISKGNLTIGVIEAFKTGIIDVPFAPSKYNLGKMMPARDNEGMIRYLDTGNLPFDDDIKNFHREKLNLRALKEKREVNFQMTVDDIFSISNGEVLNLKNDL